MGPEAIATGINDTGTVVGNATDPNNTSQSVGVTWKESSSPQIPVDRPRRFAAINNMGEIIGLNNNNLATRWGISGPEIIGGLNASLNSINELGDIVGLRRASATSPGFATLWREGVEIDLGWGPNSGATGMNDHGAVVGISSDFRSIPLLWINGSTTLLPTLGGSFTEASQINNLNQIVGSSMLPNGVQRAVLWTEDGSIIDMGGLDLGDLTRSYAIDINDREIIVGYSATSVDTRATLWYQGEVIDLNIYLSPELLLEGWKLSSASRVNEMGWIIGNATNMLTRSGAPFLLKPISTVPEPGSALLCVTAAFAMLLASPVRRG